MKYPHLEANSSEKNYNVRHRRSRLAPSPTGALHIGNAFSFLINWALARRNGWELILRMEDLDGPRKKMETVQISLDMLQWLGINWDGEFNLQSEGIHHSREALQTLINRNLVYHCELSRKEIEAVTSAPHERNLREHLSLRPKDIWKHNQTVSGAKTNWRFVATHCSANIKDACCEENELVVDEDFVVWTKSDSPSYQLAVVVDDHRQGITDVVRGNDLYHSAALQTQLYEAFGWKPPTWWHLPLILGPDGKRLAKRHGDSRVVYYKEKGVTPERIIGLVATWCNIQKKLEPMDAVTFCNELKLPSMSKEDKIFTSEDEQWLLDS